MLIRHGESMGNATRAFLGHTDLDITEKGRMQAKATADLLKDRRIDVIYSSDLIRAYNTAKPIAEAKGLEIIPSKNLREIYAGEWEGLTIGEIKARYPESYGIWRSDTMKAICDGGESIVGLQARIKREVFRIVNENKGKCICITSHAAAIGSFIDYLRTELSDPEYTEFHWVTNASVTTVDFYDDGSFSIVRESEDEHLLSIPSVPFEESKDGSK